ncbi:DNA replication/repair protein RecF [Streptococcus sp. DD13]|uniref:DNA replication/repair protein RecF n=1 Tax=Streptococcus sp. DD13 TaxID=1777881 RepID=UPI000798D99F|nr:DNA replication/repair protein RecF [Streptococcus sp. DD13]KXT77765.1 DNA recombination and repair protein RecF [Streptococcus sp. DD13]
MWIKEIELQDYRNYNHLHAEFSPQLNVFVGKNAQGKTNFLESIYFLSLTRSHRTRSDKDLISFNKQNLTIKGIIERRSGETSLEILLSDKGRTTKVNHLRQAKLSDYIGTMNVVLFAPEDLQLVKGSPSLRRKFLDIDLGQIKPVYLTDLSNYNHVLKQRNTYLKNTREIDHTFLTVLDEQLAFYGTKVIQHRSEFVQLLSKEADKNHSAISNQLESLTIQYVSSINFTDNDNILDRFVNHLSKNRQKDIGKKVTSVGPHRDDLVFTINGLNATFGSQGQQRSLILSLKLAEIELIKSVTNEYPILLLDDVMSELDISRQTKLIEGIKENVQTFITTTSLEHLHHLPDDITVFTIDHGKLV